MGFVLAFMFLVIGGLAAVAVNSAFGAVALMGASLVGFTFIVAGLFALVQFLRGDETQPDIPAAGIAAAV